LLLFSPSSSHVMPPRISTPFFPLPTISPPLCSPPGIGLREAGCKSFVLSVAIPSSLPPPLPVLIEWHWQEDAIRLAASFCDSFPLVIDYCLWSAAFGLIAFHLGVSLSPWVFVPRLLLAPPLHSSLSPAISHFFCNILVRALRARRCHVFFKHPLRSRAASLSGLFSPSAVLDLSSLLHKKVVLLMTFMIAFP